MILVLLLALPHATAFSPGVHRALAARAIELERAVEATAAGAAEGAAAGEATAEGPDPVVHADVALAFARGAADEDLNLARKWGRWHHYHSPSYAPVRSLGRHPSADRVAWLDDRIRVAAAVGNRRGVWLHAGQLAHHVQDMASPPHVVPVAHGLFDRFESYVDIAMVATVTGDGVATLPAALGPAAAQQRLAEDTTAALAIPLVCDLETMDWSAFWAPRPGVFGAYGTAGNRFGALPACASGMEAFARARLEAALAYTRAVVRYVAGLSIVGP